MSNPLPAVVAADYQGELKIRLTFDDGLTGVVDFADWLQGPIFEPLKDPSVFSGFFLDGGSIAWPNGADIAPETLYRRVKSFRAA